MNQSTKIRKPIIAKKFLEIWSKINGFSVTGFSLFKWIFVNRSYEENENSTRRKSWLRLVNHESIHYYQQKELVGAFYPLYIGNYIFNLIKEARYYNIFYLFLGVMVGGILSMFLGTFLSVAIALKLVIIILMSQHHYNAYREIVFEREAYENQEDLYYLDKREKHAWKKYWKKTK
jgi:hypothetical protein